MWFDNWESIYQIVIKSVAAYVLLVVYIRLAGKRSTSRMNNFDWIVTVAVGSVFASVILVKDISLAEGAAALGCLLLLQYALTAATAQWSWLRKAVIAPSTLLYGDGSYRSEAMRAERVSECEIESAVRGKGIHSMSQVESIIMEPDASLSVVQKPDNAAVGELWTKLEGCESNDERKENPTTSGANR